MTSRHNPFPRYSPVGESALLIELDDVISSGVNDRVYALDALIRRTPLKGIRESIPGYASVVLLFDPLQKSYSDMHQWVQNLVQKLTFETDHSPHLVEIPVRYGGSHGPDLQFVAAFHNLSPEIVVERHTQRTYRVGMMGFMPGFAYLMGLDPELATPRLKTPRTTVPAGSVGIAGVQTGIYPFESPGGWQLIGRTDLRLFHLNNDQPFLLSPGDEVRFIPIRDDAES